MVLPFQRSYRWGGHVTVIWPCNVPACELCRVSELANSCQLCNVHSLLSTNPKEALFPYEELLP